jgi:hypothetical protein
MLLINQTSRRVSRLCACGAIHKFASLLARDGNSVVGIILSVGMFRKLGSGLLLFRGRLFLRRRWLHLIAGGRVDTTNCIDDQSGLINLDHVVTFIRPNEQAIC